MKGKTFCRMDMSIVDLSSIKEKIKQITKKNNDLTEKILSSDDLKDIFDKIGDMSDELNDLRESIASIIRGSEIFKK